MHQGTTRAADASAGCDKIECTGSDVVDNVGCTNQVSINTGAVINHSLFSVFDVGDHVLEVALAKGHLAPLIVPEYMAKNLAVFPSVENPSAITMWWCRSKR